MSLFSRRPTGKQPPNPPPEPKAHERIPTPPDTLSRVYLMGKQGPENLSAQERARLDLIDAKRTLEVARLDLKRAQDRWQQFENEAGSA